MERREEMTEEQEDVGLLALLDESGALDEPLEPWEEASPAPPRPGEASAREPQPGPADQEPDAETRGPMRASAAQTRAAIEAAQQHLRPVLDALAAYDARPDPADVQETDEREEHEGGPAEDSMERRRLRR